MAVFPFSASLNRFKLQWLARRLVRSPTMRPNLTALAQLDQTCLPPFVRQSAVALKYIRLLGMLDWVVFQIDPTNVSPPMCRRCRMPRLWPPIW